MNQSLSQKSESKFWFLDLLNLIFIAFTNRFNDLFCFFYGNLGSFIMSDYPMTFVGRKGKNLIPFSFECSS